MSQYFLNHMNLLEETLMSKLVYPIMQQSLQKSATGIDTNLASLKAEIYKKDVGKLKTFPIDLSKISNVVNNDVVKKAVYDKLVVKVNNIDISGFVLKAKNDTGKSDLERKLVMQTKNFFDSSKLVKKTDYNVKISEIENKIPK